MIKEIGKDDLVLNVSLLEWGTTVEQFCLVSKVNVKQDSLGKTFIQFIIRGKNGEPIIGRLFGDTVKNYLESIETYVGKVALVSGLVDTVYGQKSLSINWIVLPTGDDLKGIKEDLFEAIVPNISKFINQIQILYKEHASVFTEAFSSFFNHNFFTSLYYISNEEVCSGKNGYAYVMLSQCWERLKLYHQLGYITSNQLSFMMTAQLACESILSQYSDTRFDYNYVVFNKLSDMLQLLNGLGTSAERASLKEIATCYMNLRLDIPVTKTEHRLATIMFNEYNTVFNNLKYLTTLESYTGIATIDGKLVR